MMATHSILKQITINNPKDAKAFFDALEKSEQHIGSEPDIFLKNVQTADEAMIQKMFGNIKQK